MRAEAAIAEKRSLTKSATIAVAILSATLGDSELSLGQKDLAEADLHELARAYSARDVPTPMGVARRACG